MFQAIPWRMIVWAIAGLVALYLIGWEVFGPSRRAHQFLVNAVTGLSFAWGTSLLLHLFGIVLNINLAMLAASFFLGIPGAALVCVLQWVL
jgi:hypothetical protein